MFHYLIVDKHNPNKGHHITVVDATEIYYNQAIKNVRMHYRDKEEVPGFPGWYDFYENERVKYLEGNHGYQNYINQAVRKWHDNDRPLEVDDVFDHYFNQANREVEILAVIDDEALGFYAMPAGRVFFGAYDRNTRKIKRTLAVKTMPKKWLALVPHEELEAIKDEYR